jgi:hypothetical protein
VSLSVEDCIAMADDGGWIAFPRDGTIRRPQVMAALARQSEWVGGYSWRETIETYSIRVGWVVESEEYPERGWWSQCDYDTPGAVPAWIATRRT